MSDMKDKRPEGTIIDAEVEPLPDNPGFFSKLGRWLLRGVIAIAICVAIAAAYHFYTTPGALPSLGGKPTAVAPAPTPMPAPQAAPAPVVDPALAQRVQDLERRLAALAASLERLQQLPAASNADAERVAGLEEALKAQAAETRKATSEAVKLAEAALTGQVQFDQKLADLSRARAADLRQPVALLLAWQSLRDRATRGSSFVAEANAVAPLLGNAAALREAFTTVQAFAANGAPTETALAGSFAQVAEAQQREVAELPPADGTTPSWWQRVLNKLTGLVTIRRVGGEVAANSADKLGVAEGLLERGDLAGALAALEGVSGGPALTAWRGGADARLKLDAALDKLQLALREHFAAAP